LRELVSHEQPEILLRLEALRRDLDARARAAVGRLVLALCASFAAGLMAGHFFWK
jgi:hypothetical protein